MAYSKKVSYRRRRSSRYRRRFRRRRYRRFNYRRRYRRSRGSKPEYKRKEFRATPTFSVSPYQRPNQLVLLISPSAYEFVCIGCENANDLPVKCIPIRQGPGVDQRIGAKIRPVALRLYGTMSVELRTQQLTAATPQLNAVNNVNACMVRMLVFQVRNGNTEYSPLGSYFSPVNPHIVVHTEINGAQVPIARYNDQAATYYCDTDWFGKIFSYNYPFEHWELNDGGGSVFDGIPVDDRYKAGVYAKCPYRNGIGASLKILKDKLYYFNPTTSPTFAFRCKTKRPYRMVWKESPNDDNELTENCKNPIYIVFIPIFPVGVNGLKICINLNCQFYFTDK